MNDDLVLFGLLQSCMVRYGHVWSYMVFLSFAVMSPYGPVWFLFVFYDRVWSRMFMYGVVWSCIFLFCPVQSCMNLHSPNWSCMLLYGHV